MITSWSHSKLAEFDKCKRRVFLMHVERVPEPARPLPAGKTEHANDRGSRIHNEAEDYVAGRSDYLPVEMEKNFGPQLDMLRVLFKDGLVSLEGEWGMSSQWEPADWKLAWHRCKLDAIVFWSKHHATVIDYKTGRKFGNEVKHGEQMMLYQLNAFLRYPDLEMVETELWYPDANELTTRSFTRAQGLRFKSNFDRRGRELTSCTKFPPNPNKHSCKWCMYGKWGTGHCEVGVRDEPF